MDANCKVLIQHAKALLEDFRPFHSELQIDNFVIGCGGDGHPWGMYVQALREIASRKSNLQALDIQHKQLELKTVELELNLPMFAILPRAKLKRAKLYLELQRVEHEKSALREQIKDCSREFAYILRIGERLRKELGPITEFKRRELDLDLWKHRLTRRIVASALHDYRPPADIVEMFPNLTPELQHALEADLRALPPIQGNHFASRFFRPALTERSS